MSRKPKKPKRHFKHFEDSYVEELSEVYRKAKLQYRTLLDVNEIRSDSDAWALEDHDLLTHFGYGDRRIIVWNTGDDDVHVKDKEWHRSLESDTTKSLGGNFFGMVGPGETLNSIVFMRIPDGDPEHWAAASIAVFYHELGHVDDFERGVNLRPNVAVDRATAEAYAHRFACQKLMRGGYRWPLAMYLQKKIPQHLQSPVESEKKAAQSILMLPEYREWRKFAQEFLDEF